MIPENGAEPQSACTGSACPQCSGAHVWSSGFGSECSEVYPEVATDRLGNVVVVGGTGYTTECSDSPIMHNGQEDILVAKWDARGALVWAKSFGNSGFQRAHDVATDRDGNSVP